MIPLLKAVLIGFIWIHYLPVAAEQRLGVIIGSNIGNSSEEALRWAEADARRFYQVLLELGQFKTPRIKLLIRPSLHSVERALAEAVGRAAEINYHGETVVFYFYYSGHGDKNSLHLGNQNLSLQRIFTVIESIPADIRIVVIDSCRSSKQQKGIRHGPSFKITSSKKQKGSVIIYSSSPGEVSQESNKLGGSVFTHYFISAMRGNADYNRDGRITLDEAYHYVYNRTVYKSSKNPAGVQHPALQLQFKGSGPFVLANLKKASSRLVFPEGDNIQYLIYQNENVVSEARSQLGGQTAIALPSGNFLVQRRDPSGYGIAEVNLPWGGTRYLKEADFKKVPYEQVVMKGGTLRLKPHDIQVGYDFEVPLSRWGGFTHRLTIEYGYSFGRFQVAIPLSIGYNQHTAENVITLGDLSLNPQLRYILPVWRFSLYFGLGVGLRNVWQKSKSKDFELKADPVYYSKIKTVGFGGGPSFHIRLQIPIYQQLSVALGFNGSILFFLFRGQSGSTVEPVYLVSPTISLGYRF